MSSGRVYEIDENGDLTINVIENDPELVDGKHILQSRQTSAMKVSSKVVIENSPTFHDMIKSKDFGDRRTLDLHGDSGETVQLWMEVLHKVWKGNHFDSADVHVQTFQDAITFGEKYKLELKKLKVWFSLWLGSRTMANFPMQELDTLLHVCQALDLVEGYNVIRFHRSERRGDIYPHIPAAYKNFPPVFGMSSRQFRDLIFKGVPINVEDHRVLGFSMTFEQTYGVPLPYSDFLRLMKTPWDPAGIPKIKDFETLMRKGTSSTFLAFCKQVDNKAGINNLAPVNRREMEAAWACIAFILYEKALPPNHLIDRTNTNLENVLRMRFHPKDRVEQYWQEKQNDYGWSDEDVERLEEGCEDETPEEEDNGEKDGKDVEMHEPDYDYEGHDEEMLELEEEFNDLHVGLTVEDLEQFGASQNARAAEERDA